MYGPMLWDGENMRTKIVIKIYLVILLKNLFFNIFNTFKSKNIYLIIYRIIQLFLMHFKNNGKNLILKLLYFKK